MYKCPHCSHAQLKWIMHVKGLVYVYVVNICHHHFQI